MIISNLSVVKVFEVVRREALLVSSHGHRKRLCTARFREPIFDRHPVSEQAVGADESVGGKRRRVAFSDLGAYGAPVNREHD